MLSTLIGHNSNHLFGKRQSDVCLFLAAVAGGVLTYKFRDEVCGICMRFCNALLVDDNETNKRVSILPPGLPNYGNTCYFNVVLQALATLKSFRKFIH